MVSYLQVIPHQVPCPDQQVLKPGPSLPLALSRVFQHEITQLSQQRHQRGPFRHLQTVHRLVPQVPKQFFQHPGTVLAAHRVGVPITLPPPRCANRQPVHQPVDHRRLRVQRRQPGNLPQQPQSVGEEQVALPLLGELTQPLQLL